MFKKVIWATDGSEHADRAMVTAVQVAKDDDAELHVVHVIEKLGSGRAAGMEVFANEDEIKVKVARQAEAIAADTGLDTRAHTIVGLGDRIASRIAEIAENEGADLIVVGTRGHGALGSLVLGSVTQRLLHLSHCPVLAVPPHVSVETADAPEPAAAAS
jgi:nucleotide-binding universal stress UspA family protein